MKKFLLFLYCILFFAGTTDNHAQASGMTLHMWMADKAVEMVQNPELKALLISQRTAYRNGSIYPDSGYIAGNTYGEISHWADFLNAYMKYLTTEKRCVYPFNGQNSCRKLLAHLLGSLAHSIGDNQFDRYYLTAVAEREFSGNLDRAGKFTDTGLDFISIMEYGRGKVIPRKYVPTRDLVKVYQSMGEKVFQKKINKGVNILFLALYGERVGAPFAYLFYKKKAPWGASHYYKEKGGIVETGKVIAQAWDQVWTILQRDPQEPSLPTFHNAGNWPHIDFWITP